MESNKKKKIQTKKLETCIICDEVLNRGFKPKSTYAHILFALQPSGVSNLL